MDSEEVQGLFSSDEGIARLMERVTDQILDQQATEQIGAESKAVSENVHPSSYSMTVSPC